MAQIPTASRRLAVHLRREELTLHAFARLVGCSHVAVMCWLNGKKTPGEAYRVRIEEVTRGAIRARSWPPVGFDGISREKRAAKRIASAKRAASRQSASPS